MALTINTNVASLNAQRNLYKTGISLNKSLQRLSSGLRINSAKDDAAGLAISDKMTAQIRGLNQAVRNAGDAISLAQTGEGAMQESTNILQRMRELAVQSSNGTYTIGDRTSLNNEFTALSEELTRISTDTTFNTTKLLDGTFNAVDFAIGADSGQNISLSIAGVDASTLGVNDDGVDTVTKAQAAITAIDTAIASVDTARGTLGAFQNRLESTISNLQSISENVSSARSRITDADFAMETANMTKAQILQQSGIAMLAQANMLPQAALSLIG